jgi:glucose/arabinose dehydrogenase
MFNKTTGILFSIFLFLGCNNQSAKDKKKNTKDTVAVIAAIQDDLYSPDTMNISKATIVLEPHLIRLQKGDSFYLNIPAGYNINIAAEIGRRLRFLALSPDGRLFATDMYDRSDNKNGRVLIFEKWNEPNKKFEKITPYLVGLHNPNQVAFHKNYIYVAETGMIRRYQYKPGDIHPKDSGEVISRFPDYGLSYKYGGWHLTRSIAFHNEKLYISVGSSCNACVEKEALRAVVLEMNPDGSETKIFARGLRNSVGIKWIGNQLWGTGMGRDLIGPDKPEDPFQQIERDGFYGWPYYFQYQQKVYADTGFKDSARAAWVKEPPTAFLGFKAHSAPLGFDYLKNFDDDVLKNAVLVCLHGSTSVWRQRGNAIVRVEKNNRYSEIVNGFLTGKTEAGRHGRPCAILMNSNRSFFFTDDLNGVLYYVWKR